MISGSATPPLLFSNQAAASVKLSSLQRRNREDRETLPQNNERDDATRFVYKKRRTYLTTDLEGQRYSVGAGLRHQDSDQQLRLRTRASSLRSRDDDIEQLLSDDENITSVPRRLLADMSHSGRSFAKREAFERSRDRQRQVHELADGFKEVAFGKFMRALVMLMLIISVFLMFVEIEEQVDNDTYAVHVTLTPRPLATYFRQAKPLVKPPTDALPSRDQIVIETLNEKRSLDDETLTIEETSVSFATEEEMQDEPLEVDVEEKVEMNLIGRQISALNRYRLLDVDLEAYQAFKPQASFWKDHFSNSGFIRNTCHHFTAGSPQTVSLNTVETTSDQIAEIHYPNVLPKLSFATEMNTTKFIFFAGLERSGQSVLQTALQALCGKPEQKRSCMCPKQNVVTLLNGLFSDANRVTRKNIQVYTDELLKVFQDKDYENKIVVLNNYCVDHIEGSLTESSKVKHHGVRSLKKRRGERTFLTYPHSSSTGIEAGMAPRSVRKGEKPICRFGNFPDVRILAELFEYLRIDFRVLVLLRNTLDVLVETSVPHRTGFQSFSEASAKKHANSLNWSMMTKRVGNLLQKDLIDNQLKRLDPTFLHCVNYLDLVPEKSLVSSNSEEPNVRAVDTLQQIKNLEGLDEFLGIHGLGAHIVATSALTDDPPTEDIDKHYKQHVLREVFKKHGIQKHLPMLDAEMELRRYCATLNTE